MFCHSERVDILYVKFDCRTSDVAVAVNDFKNKLDAYWSTQEMMYNYRTEISGTGNRSVTT